LADQQIIETKFSAADCLVRFRIFVKI